MAVFIVRDSDQPVRWHPASSILRERSMTDDRILVYRLGSLGDTIVALPALRLVAQAFPNSRRYFLTNAPVANRAPAPESVLAGTGLIDEYIQYPIGTRNPRTLFSLCKQLRSLKLSAVVYLVGARGRASALRDWAFFRSCGIPRVIGLPLRLAEQRPQRYVGGVFEYEGHRLARLLADLGDARLEDPASFDLGISTAEFASAANALSTAHLPKPRVAVSIGAKADVKNWGDGNWTHLLARASERHPGLALAMVGSADERARAERLLSAWKGPSADFCGALGVRESAALLAQTDLFVGHDSGPMHLAAAMQVPCVAIFSSRNLPGHWYPYGEDHRVLYRKIECQGCGLDVCVERKKACIASITVPEVLAAIDDVLSVRPPWSAMD